MTPATKSLVGRYSIPIASVGAALLLTHLFAPVFDTTPRVLFFGAIFISALFGGRGPSLLAILLSLIAFMLFADPRYAVKFDLANLPRIGVFLTTALLVSSVSIYRQRAEAALKKANAELEDRVKERTAELEQANTALKDEMARREVLEGDRAKLLANEQAARAEAEKANHAKDDFLAMVTHEFRNPLNNITVWLAMLSSGRVGVASTPQAMEVITRNAELLAHLVDDLLDTSRIIAGKLQMEMRPTNLVEIVAAAVESIRPAADVKGLHLKMIFPSSGLKVSGDGKRLQQIVSNLLANAVKFTASGGHIEIVIETMNIGAQIRIKDDGRGITPEALPHIFERFWQAAEGAASEHGGLGLGLAIVKYLTEMHGGTVTAESDGDNRGATFIVTLPIAVTNNLASPIGDGSPSHPN